jgi:5-methylcytosine-specific restriction endonuclease McrA
MTSGRNMGGRPYRRNRQRLLDTSDGTCALCGHPGAETADHIIPDRSWPRDDNGRRLPGFDDLENLQLAHGTMGNVGPHNRCPICRALCNQAKGDGRHTPPPQRRSRTWYTPGATL